MLEDQQYFENKLFYEDEQHRSNICIVPILIKVKKLQIIFIQIILYFIKIVLVFLQNIWDWIHHRRLKLHWRSIFAA